MQALCKTNQKLSCDLYGEAPDNPLCSGNQDSAPLIFPDSSMGQHWYAVQTRYRAEKRVARCLAAKGFQTFLPLLREVHSWSDRRRRIDTPLISGYLFLRTILCTDSRVTVLRTPGVLRFVSFSGEVAPVSEKQIEDLQKLLDNNVSCSLHAFLRVGQRVRIRGGCLQGLEGILEQSGGNKLIISFDCIERSIAIQIAGYELELV